MTNSTVPSGKIPHRAKHIVAPREILRRVAESDSLHAPLVNHPFCFHTPRTFPQTEGFSKPESHVRNLSMSEIHYTSISSPIGELTLVASDKGLRGVYMDEHKKALLSRDAWKENSSRFTTVISQLNEYFSGNERLSISH